MPRHSRKKSCNFQKFSFSRINGHRKQPRCTLCPRCIPYPPGKIIIKRTNPRCDVHTGPTCRLSLPYFQGRHRHNASTAVRRLDTAAYVPLPYNNNVRHVSGSQSGSPALSFRRPSLPCLHASLCHQRSLSSTNALEVKRRMRTK